MSSEALPTSFNMCVPNLDYVHHMTADLAQWAAQCNPSHREALPSLVMQGRLVIYWQMEEVTHVAKSV